MKTKIDELMDLADDYAKAWHASQTSRFIAAYDNGDHRKALRRALESALKPGEPVAKYIGECANGSLVQLYDDLKKGTDLYTCTPPAPPRLTIAQLYEIESAAYEDDDWDYERAIETAVRKQFGIE